MTIFPVLFFCPVRLITQLEPLPARTRTVASNTFFPTLFPADQHHLRRLPPSSPSSHGGHVPSFHHPSFHPHRNSLRDSTSPASSSASASAPSVVLSQAQGHRGGRRLPPNPNNPSSASASSLLLHQMSYSSEELLFQAASDLRSLDGRRRIALSSLAVADILFLGNVGANSISSSSGFFLPSARCDHVSCLLHTHLYRGRTRVCLVFLLFC